MSDRSHQEKTSRNRSTHAGVWRHVRPLLALAVATMLVAGSLLVKVLAVAGGLDTTFSSDGKQTTNFGGEDYANAVAIQSDGKIVTAGYGSTDGTNYDFALARYNTNGTLDTTFSGDGKQTTDFLTNGDAAYGIAIQADGKIVVAGTIGNSFDRDFAVARYNANGTLDTSFSTDGKQTTDFSDTSDLAWAVAIQSNGKIVLAGYTYDPSNTAGDDFALARYNTNGTLDTTFSTDGKQTTDFGTESDDAYAIAIQSNGKIVAAGNVAISSTGYNFALARYNTNGTLDTTFSGDGKQTTDFFGVTDYVRAVAIQSDGKIVAAGEVRIARGGTTNFGLARYNGNGSLDDGSVNDSTPNDSFGTGGKVNTDFFASFDGIYGMALQTNGKIVAVGRAAHANNTNYDFGLVRYNANGTLDTTFSTDGKQTTNFGSLNAPQPKDVARAIAIQTDGKIVVAGSSIVTSSNFALARYLDD